MQRVMSAGQGLAKGVGLVKKDTNEVEHAEKEEAKKVKSVKKDAKEVEIAVEKKYTSGDKLVENKHTKNYCAQP